MLTTFQYKCADYGHSLVETEQAMSCSIMVLRKVLYDEQVEFIMYVATS